MEKLKEAVEKGTLETVREILNFFTSSEIKAWSEEFTYRLCGRMIDRKESGMFELLFKKGIRLGTRKYTSLESLLCTAISLGSLEIAKFLLKKNVNVNFARHSHFDSRPLHFAIMYENIEMAELILKNGADVNVLSRDDIKTPLLIVTSGHYFDKDEDKKVALCKLLLDYGADLKKLDKNNDSPLNYAVKKGQNKVAKLFLERGVCVDAKAFKIAIEKGNVPLIELFLASGSKVVNSLIISETLNTAAKSKEDRILELLLQHCTNADMKLVYFASLKSQEGTVQRLLSEKAEVNYQDLAGNSALSMAAKRGNTNIVKLLLQNGAATNCTLKNFKTNALIEAVKHGHTEIVKLLLDHQGGEAQDTTDNGAMLDLAVYSDHDQIVKLLLDILPDATASRKAEDLFVYAAKNGNYKIVELLLSRVPNYLRNSHTRQSLYIATRNGHEELIKVLLGRVKINLAHLLVVAAGAGKDQVVEILLKRGAPVNGMEPALLERRFVDLILPVNYQPHEGPAGTFNENVARVGAVGLPPNCALDVNEAAAGPADRLAYNRRMNRLRLRRQINVNPLAAFNPEQQMLDLQLAAVNRQRRNILDERMAINQDEQMLELQLAAMNRERRNILDARMRLLENERGLLNRLNLVRANRRENLDENPPGAPIEVVDLDLEDRMLLLEPPQAAAQGENLGENPPDAPPNDDVVVLADFGPPQAPRPSTSREESNPPANVNNEFDVQLRRMNYERIRAKLHDNHPSVLVNQEQDGQLNEIFERRGAAPVANRPVDAAEQRFGYLDLPIRRPNNAPRQPRPNNDNNNRLAGAAGRQQPRPNDPLAILSTVEPVVVPLFAAAEQGNLSTVQLLLEQGADVNAKSGRGYTALHFAARSGDREIVKKILDSGISDIDAKAEDGKTALFEACMLLEFTKGPYFFKLMLERGVDINVEDVNGEIALRYAATECARKMFIKEACKRKSKNQPVNEKIWKYINGNSRGDKRLLLLQKYRDACNLELEDMKKVKFSGAFVSYHDIFTEGVEQIANYMKNENISKELEKGTCMEKYP